MEKNIYCLCKQKPQKRRSQLWSNRIRMHCYSI